MIDDREESRPNPDELLSRITAAEAEDQPRDSRGKLKIFFGACAGVGKTYAMLSAAQSALKEGRDVVIGVVETHGREETLRLTEGIPTIAPKEIAYRGTTLKEFDIDTALTQKPSLILLDELAHTNAPGSRHPKRWHDVEELLDAGIDVYTTLNVQHLESLNDVVARITGIMVKETVPDAVFDKADEISLVDIPSEELLKRLKEGKVYIAPQAKKRAAQNFFRTTNLIALREMALRRTAERVDAQMDTYKTRTGTTQGWTSADRILVCIGPTSLSQKLVRVGKRMAGGLKAPWTVLYIENDRHYALSKEEQDNVERTLRLAERMGAKSEIVHGQRAADEIVSYARANGITKIILGASPRSRWREFWRGSLVHDILELASEIDLHVVTQTDDTKKHRFALWRTRSPLPNYLIAPVTATLCSLGVLPLAGNLDSVNMVLVYLAGIMFVAVRYGRGPSLLTTVLSVFFYDFFFIPPLYTIDLSIGPHLITFFGFVLCGMMVASQTSKLRLQLLFAMKREKHTASLYAMTKELTASRGRNTMGLIAARHIGEILDAKVDVWIPNTQGGLERIIDERNSDFDEGAVDWIREESAARFAYTHKQHAGLGTDTLPSAAGLYVPLESGNAVVGALGVIPRLQITSFPNEMIELLDTQANLTASALERANVAEKWEKSNLEAESEKLRNILLSSVSHDLRMPLASITSATSTLLLEHEKQSEEYRKELLRLIHEDAARLARIVTNLLDVTSLESGSVKLNKEPYFIEELIGSALMRTESILGKRMVETKIEHGIPLVRMDALLIEQVLINLLENVADYTPENTNVVVNVYIDKPDLHVVVQDDGPGIPSGDEERIFDKFYNAAREADPAKQKTGLGLAICRGIIRAHGGKIWAQNSPNGGAIFTFTLPIRMQEES